MKVSHIAKMIVCVAPLLTACEGVRFAQNEAPVNLTPPGELKTVVPAGAYRTDLSALVGTVAVYNKTDKSLQVLEQIYDPYDPRTRPVVEVVNTPIYKTLLTKNMITDAPVIAAAVKAADPDSLDLTVVDEAHASVPKYHTDILTYFASKYRPTNPNEELVYVSEAHLRHLTATKLTQTNVNARAADTPVVGYNGKVYTHVDGFKNDYYLSVSIVPFSRLGAVKPGETLEPYPQGAVEVIKPQITNPQAYYVGNWHRHGLYGNYRDRTWR